MSKQQSFGKGVCMHKRGDVAVYEIQVQEHMRLDWSSWLHDVTAMHTQEGTTTVVGQVQDQAALHGLLAKIRDLGIVVLAITRRD